MSTYTPWSTHERYFVFDVAHRGLCFEMATIDAIPVTKRYKEHVLLVTRSYVRSSLLLIVMPGAPRSVRVRSLRLAVAMHQMVAEVAEVPQVHKDVPTSFQLPRRCWCSVGIYIYISKKRKPELGGLVSPPRNPTGGNRLTTINPIFQRSGSGVRVVSRRSSPSAQLLRLSTKVVVLPCSRCSPIRK